MANGEISVAPGEFRLTIGMMPGGGSYQAATMRYDFRYEPGCFRLIRYVRAETHRATLATHDTTVDFLTGDVTDSTGNAGSGGTTTRRTRLEARARHCLSALPSGWTFDPLRP